MSIDRQALIDNVTQARQKPAYAVVPYGLPDVMPGDDSGKGRRLFSGRCAKAKELLAEAGYPDARVCRKLRSLLIPMKLTRKSPRP